MYGFIFICYHSKFPIPTNNANFPPRHWIIEALLERRQADLIYKDLNDPKKAAEADPAYLLVVIWMFASQTC